MEILLRLDGEEGRPTKRRVLIPASEKQVATYESCPVYHDNDAVTGEAVIKLREGHQFSHRGVCVELIGLIEKGEEGGAPGFEFLRVKLPLLGVDGSPIREPITRLPFSFGPVKMPYASYDGQRVCLHYSVRVTIIQRTLDLVRERTLWLEDGSTPLLRTPPVSPHPSTSLPDSLSAVVSPKMVIEKRVEVGLDDFLHLEMDFERTSFALSDINLRGSLHFLLVRLRITSVELHFVRREIIDVRSPQTMQDAMTICCHQIMEGPAFRGDTIPFELTVQGDLTPTYENVARQFSVRYYVALVIHDEEGRRYFRQQEILLTK